MSFFDLIAAILVLGATLVCGLMLAVMTVACGSLWWVPWLIIFVAWRKLHLPTPLSTWRWLRKRREVQSKLDSIYASQCAKREWAQRWITYLIAQEGLSCPHERTMRYSHDPAITPALDRCVICEPYSSLDDPKVLDDWQ